MVYIYRNGWRAEYVKEIMIMGLDSVNNGCASSDKWATYCWRRRNGLNNPKKYDYTPALTKKQLCEEFGVLIRRNDEIPEGYEIYQDTEFGRKRRPVYLSTSKHKHGKDKYYYIANIYNLTTRKCKTIPLHRLVYVMYVGDIPTGYVVDHINNDIFDNNPDNLQLLTRAENTLKDRKGKTHNQYTYLKGQA